MEDCSAALSAANAAEGEQRVELFHTAAEALVRSLATGTPLISSTFADPLCRAFCAELADRSDEAEARCCALRQAFAAEVRQAVAAEEATRPLLDGGVDIGEHGVYVEVRGTAGRWIQGHAFVSGSADECDIQVVGDRAVLPVQCLVVLVPTGLLVADVWSCGRTRLAWRWSPALAPPPAPGAAFHVAHGEQVILRLGPRTTLKLAPQRRASATCLSDKCGGEACREAWRRAAGKHDIARSWGCAVTSEPSTSYVSEGSAKPSPSLSSTSRSRSPPRRNAQRFSLYVGSAEQV